MQGRPDKQPLHQMTSRNEWEGVEGYIDTIHIKQDQKRTAMRFKDAFGI